MDFLISKAFMKLSVLLGLLGGSLLAASANAQVPPTQAEPAAYSGLFATVANDLPALEAALAAGCSARNVTSRYDGGYAAMAQVLERAAAR